MMMPSILEESLFDSWMKNFPLKSFWEDSRFPSWGKDEKGMMKTDVREQEGNYLVDMELPGVKKEDVKAQLKEGYLTISATSNMNKDEKDKEGNYIRRERYTGQCSRTFFVGEDVTEEEIKAKFEDGMLTLSIPKKEVKAITTDRYIPIE